MSFPIGAPINRPSKQEPKDEWVRQGNILVNQKTKKFKTIDFTLDAIWREFDETRKKFLKEYTL